ncbi:MAG: hypothetical protein AAF337_13980 [Pseudomonadota bacterium]
MSLVQVHALVRDLYRQPDLFKRFQQTPEDVLRDYDITADERAQLLDGSPGALHALGMHPLVQMVYGVAKNPAMKTQLAVTAYLHDIGVDAS